VHLQRRVLADEGPGCAGVVEVDVAEQEVPDVGQGEAAVGEARLQRLDCGGGPAVEERRPVVGVEQIARDDPLAAEMVEVDGLEYGQASILRDRPLRPRLGNRYQDVSG
jgi:hypothetical protein